MFLANCNWYDAANVTFMTSQTGGVTAGIWNFYDVDPVTFMELGILTDTFMTNQLLNMRIVTFMTFKTGIVL